MSASRLKVSFIDHHLQNWHADTFLNLLRGPLLSEGLDVVSAWESNPETQQDWCAVNGVPRAASIDEAIEAADVIVLLSPDNIEEHLKLAHAVLPAGKPTLIDKFLAPTEKEALQIVELAKMHGAPIFSSSSLRYAVELDAAMPAIVNGNLSQSRFMGYGKWGHYGVHTLCMALRVNGYEVKRMIDTGVDNASVITLDYGGEKRAVLDVRTGSNDSEHFGWSFEAKVDGAYIGAKITDYDGFYANLMRNAAAFFKAGKSDMDVEEAIWTVRLLESADRSRAADGMWITF